MGWPPRDHSSCGIGLSKDNKEDTSEISCFVRYPTKCIIVIFFLVHSEIYDLVMLSQFVTINHIDPDHCCVQPKIRILGQLMLLQYQICLP